MGIDVIRAVLRIIFQDKNRRFLPVTAMGNRLDDAAEGEVVVGDHRARSRRTWRGAIGVVVAEANNRQPREIPVAIELPELFEPDVRPLLIGDTKIERWVRGMDNAFEAGHICTHLATAAPP